jgi:hypothetical protein
MQTLHLISCDKQCYQGELIFPPSTSVVAALYFIPLHCYALSLYHQSDMNVFDRKTANYSTVSQCQQPFICGQSKWTLQMSVSKHLVLTMFSGPFLESEVTEVVIQPPSFKNAAHNSLPKSIPEYLNHIIFCILFLHSLFLRHGTNYKWLQTTCFGIFCWLTASYQ